MSDVFFPMLFGSGKHHYKVTRDAMPEDTKIVNVQVRFLGEGCQSICFLLESAEWEPNEDGKPYPQFSPVMTRIEDKDA